MSTLGFGGVVCQTCTAQEVSIVYSLPAVRAEEDYLWVACRPPASLAEQFDIDNREV